VLILIRNNSGKNEWIFVFLAWQPIPVHTVIESEDNLLSSHADCPKFNYLMDHSNELPEIKAINEKYDWVFKYLSEKTGGNVTK